MAARRSSRRDRARPVASLPVLSALPEDDRSTLVAEQADGGLRFDIHMQGDRQTVFFEH